MKRVNELSPKDLKDVCDPKQFKFETTKDLKESDDLFYGQERGIDALEFGLDVKIDGYNLYLEGTPGVGKTSYCKKTLTKRALNEKAPDDWCYIYNFENPNEPIAVNLPAGHGKVFQDTMDMFIKDIRIDIKKTFNNDDFEKEKNLIKKDYDKKKDDLLNELNKRTLVQGFEVKSVASGIYMMPVLDGKTLEEDEYEALDDEVKKDFEERSEFVQQEVLETLGQMKSIEKEADKKVEEWQSSVALVTINVHINSIKKSYKRNKIITKYLDDVKSDILKNLNAFLANDVDETMQSQNPNQTQEKLCPWLNYRVNLFVDNSNLEGAPVIMESSYSYSDLFGSIEYENRFGAVKTDFTMLKPGLMHKANGGYIVLHIKDLMAHMQCYEALKNVLKAKEIGIEPITENTSTMVMVSVKASPIPLNVKVLLIGDSDTYHTLLSMDEDFRELFKIKVEFEDDAPKTEENIEKLALFIRNYCIKEELMDLDNEAVAKVVEYASKLADDKEKISTHFSQINEIVGEAATWAKRDKVKIVTKEYVQKAFDERMNRLKKYDKMYLQMIEEDALLIDTEGYKKGQINGLTIMTVGDYSFGKPARITANTYMGKAGVVDIEREVNLSGPSHSKGVMILNGYLGEQFADDSPLSLTASICFEQLYGEVDGDSASSTELYAILSSLSDLPINQSIAVTGSVNQKGDIQPIGGVNEKIEGFYQICKKRGLNNEQGVIIPVQNIRNLSLSDELIDDVRKGAFHIYAVSTINEGIEILTGVPAGEKDKDGLFPHGTVNFLVNEKLKKYAKKSYENFK